MVVFLFILIVFFSLVDSPSCADPDLARDGRVEDHAPDTEDRFETGESEKSITDDMDEHHTGFLTEGFVLKGLDKTTARTFEMRGVLNQPYHHKTLTLYVRQCWKSGPDDNPESIAYLDIFEQKANMTPIQVFSGWMFASEHSVSALEHPVYDVWVKACEGKETVYRPNSKGTQDVHPHHTISSLEDLEHSALPEEDKTITHDDRMKAVYRGLQMDSTREEQEPSAPEVDDVAE